MHNWAGNHTYRARAIVRPRSLDELQELVRSANAVRALGTRHSFNDLADTDGNLVVLDEMPMAVTVDVAAHSVTIDGATRYGDLVAPLDEAGVALANLASLPHISVIGACATGTHGSGDRSRILASALTELRVVRGDGELVTIGDGSGNPSPELDAAAVSLGGIGVVVGATLSGEPAYSVRQSVYETLSERAFADHFDDITGLADSVSVFTTWRDPGFQQVWLKQRVPSAASAHAPPMPTELYGATLATRDLHPVPGMSPEACTTQRGIPGPWHARLPHFRMEFTPSAGVELQSEYFVDRRNVVDALGALRALRPLVAPLVQVTEIRTIAADGLWLSPAYRRDSAAIHFTWKPDWPAVRQVLPAIEAGLAPYDPRPHWGKLFTLPAEVIRGAYPKRTQFAAFARSMDPAGKFTNAFLGRHIFGDEALRSR